jgi:alkanesulfonate monooxygenase SsuD/methylene tetrahydromethanopterin reductase-like flavin-dependent oxidoreductase (luciferase family)
MIKSFSTLYAGHVLEGEGVGFNGIPHDERWYPNERLIKAFDIAKEAAILVEDLGYDIFWMAEHHFQREGYECIPNLLILSQHLAQVTKRIKFGCGFNILPMWHPIRLAEDFAMVDILTGGRVVFGIGRGYHTREVESFGAPLMDAGANRELFEEQFEIIMKAFDQESLSRIRPERGYSSASSDQPAGRGMAAYCQWDGPGFELYGQVGHQRSDPGYWRAVRG